MTSPARITRNSTVARRSPPHDRAGKAGRSDRTSTRDARRRQLVDATIQSIAELGLSGTTLSTVTERAGLSHGTVNFHFRSKKRLFVETLKSLAEEHRDRWYDALRDAEPRPEAQLTAMVEVDFDPLICNQTRLSVWFAFWGELKCRPMYREICGQMDAERLAEFDRLCHQIRDEGQYRRVDPRLVATSLQALVDGAWLNMLCQPEVYPNEEGLKMCLASLAAVYPRHFPAVDPDCGGG